MLQLYKQIQSILLVNASPRSFRVSNKASSLRSRNSRCLLLTESNTNPKPTNATDETTYPNGLNRSGCP
jgi:hypothetical protein